MNVLGILGRFNIQLDGHWVKGGTELQTLCPFHDESQPSFYLNLERGVYYCFGCGASGNVFDLIEHLTDLSHDEIKRVLKGEGIEFSVKPLPKRPKRFLTEQEIEILTWYIRGLNYFLTGEIKTRGEEAKRFLTVMNEYRDYLINRRGFTMEAIKHFQLGAIPFAIHNLNKSRKYIEENTGWYWHWFRDDMICLGFNPNEIEQTLRDLFLINRRGSDYWFRPAIIIPYTYQGEVYWATGRILDEFIDDDFPAKYMGMKGVPKEFFFNHDALNEYDEVFCVEGEFNAVAMWCAGYRNVVSFGGKNSLTDELIEHLWGKRVILYMDTDESDPEFKARTKALEKIREVARAVGYFEMPLGEDPASFLKNHSREDFENRYLSNIVWVDEDEWGPHERRPRFHKPQIISLKEAQSLTRETFRQIAEHLPAFSGKKILINMPVGTHKTTGIIEELLNKVDCRILVAVGQHNLAAEYETRLQKNSVLHLFGRTHPATECAFRHQAEELCEAGYSYYFAKTYCGYRCGKPDCDYPQQKKQAKHANTLIITHSHAYLFDFLTNPRYGNDKRRLVVVDEMPKLCRDIWFTMRDIEDNLTIFNDLANYLAHYPEMFGETLAHVELFIQVLLGMKEAIREGEDFSPTLELGDRLPEKLNQREIKAILKLVKPRTDGERLRRFMLSELVYALDNKLKLFYGWQTDGQRQPGLFYIWRPKFHPQATVVFLSATTTKDYLANQLDTEIHDVVGEQYYVRRQNLHVAQLVNLTGSRSRLVYAAEGTTSPNDTLRDNLRLFFRLCLRKHKDERIVIVTSLGANKIDEKRQRGWVKDRVINLLSDIAEAEGRKLVPVSTQDLEEQREFTFKEIPVLHHGMLGTNLFAGYDVCIELNAHYYNPNTIIEDIRAEYGVTLKRECFRKVKDTFKTLDEEFEIERWGYHDPKYPEYSELVDEYLRNNPMADMIQAEGRILRGEDRPQWVYRLHNVNIVPYPNKVYRSWRTMLRKEFGYAPIQGKAKEVLEWLRANVGDGEFTLYDIPTEVGGYRPNKIRVLRKLEELGYVQKVSQGKWHDKGRWRLITL
ncbi:MAG: hypothetical protein DRN90_00665 [Thermoproteota archaeon]|nr:MAG: hypothetical protein DRG83_01255 [Deltaproteobacteria bacterium]RLG49897.1 MAG: hypothetical protein DRN90_00665 [Candidatus Korarchaeota archaeon]HDO75855.1 hypothetical protein [Candidatus Poribacteria bacterium]HEX29460.1 hypothetical protein [Candidatus Poribacteria bacterium]